MEKEKATYHNYLGIQYSMIIMAMLLNIKFSLFNVVYHVLPCMICISTVIAEVSIMYLSGYHIHRIPRITDSNDYKGQQDNINH